MIFIFNFFVRCTALTAELMNGTLVGMRGCYPSDGGECTNISACNQRNQSLPAGIYFKRCLAECCFKERCNKGLLPVLPQLPSPSTVHTMASSATAVAVNATQASTTQAHTSPSNVGVTMKLAFVYLPILLMLVTDIMM